jgi:hypothetical protein
VPPRQDHVARAFLPVQRRPGYVLIAVLIVIVVLSLAAYQFTELMSSEYRVAIRTNDAAQARLSAISGVHYAAGVLADRDTFWGQLGGNPYDNSDYFADVTVRGHSSNPRLEGRFSLVCAVRTGGGSSGYETRYGVTDEAGKLNINALIALDPSGQLLHDALMALKKQDGTQLLTEEIADAIVDWVDADDDPRTNGAESSYYGALTNGYKAKNGPLNSLDELLLVKGVTPQLLFGNDRNRNGLPDDDPTGSAQFDRGLAEFLTLYGRELNVDSLGNLRVYLNQDDMTTLYQQLQQAVGPELAAYIVAYKVFNSVTTTTTGGSGSSSGTSSGSTSGPGGSASSTTSGGNNNQNNQPQPAALDQLTAAVETMLQNSATSRRQIKNTPLTLISSRVTLPAQPAQQGQPAPPPLYYDCPLNDPNKVVELLPLLVDKVTAKADIEMVPRLNVNTAPREVLMTLTTIAPTSASITTGGSGSGTSGGTSSDTTGGTTVSINSAPLLTEADVDNIINLRDSLNPGDPATITGTWLVTVAKISPDTYKLLEKFVTGRTMVYRVQSIGYFGKGGPVARVEAVIDVNQGAPRILYFRDLTELDNPRGFEPPRRE